MISKNTNLPEGPHPHLCQGQFDFLSKRGHAQDLEFLNLRVQIFKCNELAFALLRIQNLPSFFLHLDKILTKTKILTNKSIPSKNFNNVKKEFVPIKILKILKISNSLHRTYRPKTLSGLFLNYYNFNKVLIFSWCRSF